MEQGSFSPFIGHPPGDKEACNPILWVLDENPSTFSLCDNEKSDRVREMALLS